MWLLSKIHRLVSLFATHSRLQVGPNKEFLDEKEKSHFIPSERFIYRVSSHIGLSLVMLILRGKCTLTFPMPIHK